MNKAQLKVLAIGIPGIFAVGFFSRFYIDTYNSFDKINQIYLSELFASIIAIAIFVIRKKFKTEQLEPYELLSIIIIGAIAGMHLIPVELFSPTLIIVASIIILVGWFVYCGLWKYISEEREINTQTFLTMLVFFIGLTVVIIAAFNIERVFVLFTPDD